MTPSNKFEDLVALVSILRKECPWDRKQTHESIKDNLIEEAYEAVEAIDNKDPEELSKELGDLLLHVVFQSKIASEPGHFTINDVIYRISEKLIRRHPHVFEQAQANNETQVAANWEAIKMKEGKKSVLDGIPRHLPGLIKAHRMQEKVSNVGFDWDDLEPAWEKFEEEIREWRESIQSENREEQKKEFGDVLFTLVNIGRLMGLNAEDSIRLTNKKFESRFRYIENRLTEKGSSVVTSTLAEMDELWEEAKRE